MLWPTKKSYKEFDNEKNSCGSKIPLPPLPPLPHHNFSNGPSLSLIFSERAASANEVARELCARAAQSLIKS